MIARLMLLLSLAACLGAAEVDFASRVSPAPAEAAADRLQLGIAFMKSAQAQLLAMDAQLEHAAGQMELQGALAALGSLDGARARILAAQQRLARLQPESERQQQAYTKLLNELKTKYKAEACEPTLELQWQCPAGSGGPERENPATQ